MRNKIILLSLVFSLTAAPAFANGAGSSKEESVGVGVGAVIGAIAGGPVGMIVGAAFGAKVGDEFNERNTKVDSLSSSLTSSKSRVSQLKGDVDALNGEIDGLGADLQRMHENLSTIQDRWRAFAHKHIVATDVGLTLDAVQDQELGIASASLHQFLRGREYSATKADNAPIEYPQQQLGRCE